MRKPKKETLRQSSGQAVCKHGFPTFQTCYGCKRVLVGNPKQWERSMSEPTIKESVCEHEWRQKLEISGASYTALTWRGKYYCVKCLKVINYE